MGGRRGRARHPHPVGAWPWTHRLHHMSGGGCLADGRWSRELMLRVGLKNGEEYLYPALLELGFRFDRLLEVGTGLKYHRSVNRIKNGSVNRIKNGKLPGQNGILSKRTKNGKNVSDRVSTFHPFLFL
jgi:hypothetical protein